MAEIKKKHFLGGRGLTVQTAGQVPTLQKVLEDIADDLATLQVAEIATADAAVTAVANANDLATAIALVNDVKAKYNAAVTLINELKTALNAVNGGTILTTKEA